MNLKQYISSERGRASRLACEMNVSLSYLSQMASGRSPISPEKAVLIEKVTDGLVSRKVTRPSDWQLIWPDLNNSQIQNKQVS